MDEASLLVMIGLGVISKRWAVQKHALFRSFEVPR